MPHTLERQQRKVYVRVCVDWTFACEHTQCSWASLLCFMHVMHSPLCSMVYVRQWYCLVMYFCHTGGLF